MPPKRAFTDDYSNGSNPSPTSSTFLPPKRRKTYTGGVNDWRRPSASSRDGWWSVPEAEWERMPPAMKMNWTHVGRIMETEEGEPAPEPCEQCRDAGDPRGCWVYSREAMRRYGFKTHVCARCRATANVCSLNVCVDIRTLFSKEREARLRPCRPIPFSRTWRRDSATATTAT